MFIIRKLNEISENGAWLISSRHIIINEFKSVFSTEFCTTIDYKGFLYNLH